LECFPILLVGCVFNGDSVVTFANFTAFLRFSLALLWNIYKSRRGVGSETYLVMSSYKTQLG
jgi:hypothetical protein